MSIKTLVFLLLILFLPAICFPQNNLPQITPSTVLDELQRKKEQNPQISAGELADYGNELLAKQGFNFGFLTCEIAEANNITDEFSENFRPFNYTLKDLNGKEINFRLMQQSFGHPCGCDFGIPVFQITESEMTVRADNKPFRLKRPKEFVLDEVELVDKSLKKTIRKWQMPGDNVPFGISKDGTKIYVETGYDHDLINEIVLEISDNGTFRFVPRNAPNIISKADELENFPKDPDNSYLGYIRFSDKNTTYFIKFSYPCT